jgi:hypothetical protein
MKSEGKKADVQLVCLSRARIEIASERTDKEGRSLIYIFKEAGINSGLTPTLTHHDMESRGSNSISSTVSK